MGAGVVIITDGARPVLVVRPDGSPFGVEAYCIDKIVATSGAGNLFRAGVIYGWLHPEWSLERKVQFACAASGLYCQRERGADLPPSLERIEALMRASLADEWTNAGGGDRLEVLRADGPAFYAWRRIHVFADPRLAQRCSHRPR